MEHRSPSGSRIQRCETRLALSASLAGAALLDVFGQDLSGNEATDPDDWQTAAADGIPGGQATAATTSLLDQAASLRERFGLSGAGQTVAVIDSGIAWDHVALGGNGYAGHQSGSGFGPGYRVVGGWDFAENDADPYDDGPAGYHGTHVAGLLAGESESLVGVAPGADLVALRVFDDAGAGNLEWIESALRWVHDSQDDFENPITTVNLSIGAALNESNRDYAMGLLEDEFRLLRDDGILVFAAAGNFFGDAGIDPSSDSLLYPASSPDVIAVSSIDGDGALSPFAQRQDDIFAADGESMISAVPDHLFGWDGRVNDFAKLSGTSMATPQLAAASVLVREAMIDQGLSPTAQDVLSRLDQASIESVDPVTGIRYRTIDLHAAVADLVGPDPVGQVGGESEGPPEDTPIITSEVVTDHESQQFVLDLRDGMKLTVGDQNYHLETGSDGQAMLLDAAGGADSLHIIGSAGSERLRLFPSTTGTDSRLISGGATITLRGFEDVTFEGGGGSDRATLYDSGGDDQLQSHPDAATLTGVGFRFEVIGVSRTYVHATAGGNDVAYLYDSVGDDELAVQPQFTSLRGSNADGDATFQSAYGFERVYAYATGGGYNTAELLDSPGDDVLTVSASRALISSEGYQVSARHFDSVTAKAIAGGDDLAKIYSDQADSRWHVIEGLAQWTTADGSTRIARGFPRVEAFENFVSVEFSVAPLAGQTGFEAFSAQADRAAVEDARRRIFEDLPL